MKTHAMIKHEMKNKVKVLFVFALVLMVTVLLSCNDESINASDPEDTETAQLDATEDYYQEDAEDLGVAVMEETDGNSGGRSASLDDRLACASVTRTGDQTAGTITIDFGDGCTDARGNVRSGSIFIQYEGRLKTPGSTWTLTFQEYAINDIAISGSREVANISASEEGTQKFTVVMENATMTWPDGSVATRTVHKTREVERDENNVIARVIVSGTAEGTHRNGKAYSIEILKPLVHDRGCAAEGVFIPVSGKKLIKRGIREITVDYGDGTCDNSVTITNKNGRTWTHTVGQD